MRAKSSRKKSVLPKPNSKGTKPVKTTKAKAEAEPENVAVKKGGAHLKKPLAKMPVEKLLAIQRNVRKARKRVEKNWEVQKRRLQKNRTPGIEDVTLSGNARRKKSNVVADNNDTKVVAENKVTKPREKGGKTEKTKKTIKTNSTPSIPSSSTNGSKAPSSVKKADSTGKTTGKNKGSKKSRKVVESETGKEKKQELPEESAAEYLKSANTFSESSDYLDDLTPAQKFSIKRLEEAYAKALPLTPFDHERLVDFNVLMSPPADCLIKAIAAAVELGAHPPVAARAVGINYAVLKRWSDQGLRDYLDQFDTQFSKFVRVIDAAEAGAEVQSLDMIRAGFKHGPTLLSVLERRFPSRWTLRQAVETATMMEGAVKETIELPSIEYTSKVTAIMQELQVMTHPEQIEEPKPESEDLEVPVYQDA